MADKKIIYNNKNYKIRIIMLTFKLNPDRNVLVIHHFWLVKIAMVFSPKHFYLRIAIAY
jgi:hypothetical protein